MTTLHRSVAGAIGMCLIGALALLGLRAGMGAFEDTTSVWVTVGEAGQGLVSGSDVKARGVVVGEVGEIALDDDRRRAVIELVVDEGVALPQRSTFSITGKTLLGEKQVEVDFDGPIEHGPHLADGERVDEPDRVVEVEDLLGALQPVLDDIEVDDLAVVTDELLGGLADSGDDLARFVDRGAAATGALRGSVGDQTAAVSAAPRLTDELADRADDVNVLSERLVAGLPTISRDRDGLARLLATAESVASTGTETLVGTRADLDALIASGASITRVMGAYSQQVGEVVEGLALYGSRFEPGFTAPGVRGQALRLQIMFHGDDFAAPLCDELPDELAEQTPGCGLAPPADSPDATRPDDLESLLRSTLEAR